MSNSPAQWFSIEITVDPRAVEALEFLLNELGALGTEVQQFHKKENDPLVVIGYFDELPEEPLFDQHLSNCLGNHNLPKTSVKSIERKTIQKTDWLAEWKKHWRPMRIGRFLVAPEWEDLREADIDSVIIRIEPNMAFGTGTHETTRLCLLAIDEYFNDQMSFLDVGTGTGILAIAAVKHGKIFTSGRRGASSAKFLALDTDPDSIKIAKENAITNHVNELIEFRCDELTDEIPAVDFVCANLTLDVILPILPGLLAKAKKFLVLSGILIEQEKSLQTEIRRLAVKNVKIVRDGEWIAAIISR